MDRLRFSDQFNRSTTNTGFLKYARRMHLKIPRWAFLSCLFSVGPLGLIHAMQPDFGPNVTIFDPSMPATDIQDAVNAVSQVQASTSSQFDTARYAFLFKPGAYNVNVQVGYYTSVAGLGLSPDDVIINGIVPNLWREGSDPNNPTLIQDVFFRIGGAIPGQATISLQINSDNVLLDDIWAWRADHGNGFASYKVDDDVRSHQGWGLGAYCFFNVNPSNINDHAFEVPDTPGVQFHDLVTVSLGGVGTIEHVINETGGTASPSKQVVYLLSYP